MVEPDMGGGDAALTRASPEALAERIGEAWLEYLRRFDGLTARASDRFARREWAEGQRDARERILLYADVLAEAVPRVMTVAGDAGVDGPRAKERFARWCQGRSDVELAETFYNSVVRRVWGVVGANPALEFSGHDLDRPPPAPPPVLRYRWDDDPAAVFRSALSDLPVPAPFRAMRECAEMGAWRLVADLARHGVASAEAGTIQALELLPTLFYRNKGAYAVGRVLHRGGTLPVVLALVNPPGGVEVDAVLLTSDEASVVFGFTRSYLHARLEHPGAVVGYLLQLIPSKRIDELYTAVGWNRHGKTELYRALMAALEEGSACFEPAPGARGLVMIVFTLPGLNVVFKVIRDRFGAPKRTSRSQVRRNYRLIFTRDRVGRLADAQEFERLELPRSRFSTEVLDELEREAGRTVTVGGDVVRIDHLYTERRVRPLDLYLEEADAEAARAATVDFGRAIKELAAADLFPGDMLTKNFGVTRHGRVIFYDYDEVRPLGECAFRALPPAHPSLDMLDEPWYGVAEEDVFPEEWRGLIGPPGELGEVFTRVHGDLFEVEFWRSVQRRQAAGEIVDFFPYPEHRRLRHGSPPRR